MLCIVQARALRRPGNPTMRDVKVSEVIGHSLTTTLSHSANVRCRQNTATTICTLLFPVPNHVGRPLFPFHRHPKHSRHASIPHRDRNGLVSRCEIELSQVPTGRFRLCGRYRYRSRLRRSLSVRQLPPDLLSANA